MASVWGPKQLPSGTWRIRWRASDGSQPSKTYDTRGEATRAARELEAKLGPTLRGARRALGPQPPTHLTIAQIAMRWRETREGSAAANRPGADRYMAEAVREAQRIATDLGWLHSRDANAADVANLKRLRKNAGVARPLSYLRAILRWGREHAEQILDPAADVALRAPQSRKATKELLTDRQARAVLARARRFQQLPAFSCLATYGWRPITACRLNVGDVDVKRGVIRIAIKHNGEPWEHPIFPFHAEQIGRLVAGRGADEPLFVSPRSQRPRKDGSVRSARWSNGALGQFYRDNLAHDCVGTGNVYALKRLAMTRMHLGLWPWPEPLSISDIQLFTGHKTKEQVLRYLATNSARAQRLVRGALRGAHGAKDGQESPSTASVAVHKSLGRNATPTVAK